MDRRTLHTAVLGASFRPLVQYCTGRPNLPVRTGPCLSPDQTAALARSAEVAIIDALQQPVKQTKASGVVPRSLEARDRTRNTGPVGEGAGPESL